MHEPGIIMGEGKENYKTMETAKRFLDCTGERRAWFYTAPIRRAIDTPFPPTYDNRRNHLKLAFREQDKIVLNNLHKGRMGKQWI
jgi:hypothetical protein